MFNFSNLTSRVNNIVREGEVSEVYTDRHSCRVTFEDKSGLVSAELPVLTLAAYKNKSYSLPDVGERVICLMVSNDSTSGSGYVIGSLYTGENKPTEDNQNLTKLEFADGTFAQYERKDHELKIKFGDDAAITYKGTGDEDFLDEEIGGGASENEKHTFTFEFQDKTKMSYENDDEDHEFKFAFNDDAEISYSNDDENHKFQIKFNDSSEIVYENGDDNSKFEFSFKDGTKFSYEMAESSSEFKWSFKDGGSIGYEMGEDSTQFELKFSDGSSVTHDSDSGDMEVKVTGDLKINSDGEIQITSADEMELTAGADVVVKGSNIRLN